MQSEKVVPLPIFNTLFGMTKGINRLKVVLAEKRKTNKWLAQQLDKAPTTVSKWCSNISQTSVETLLQMANMLQVDVKDLLQYTPQNTEMVYIRVPKSETAQK